MGLSDGVRSLLGPIILSTTRKNRQDINNCSCVRVCVTGGERVDSHEKDEEFLREPGS